MTSNEKLLNQLLTTYGCDPEELLHHLMKHIPKFIFLECLEFALRSGDFPARLDISTQELKERGEG